MEASELYSDNLRDTHWLGKVVDNEDPLLNGRCRVMVYGKFDKIETSAIPWATPANRNMVGSHMVPRIGDIVSIKFDNGDIYHPEYIYQIDQNTSLKDDVLSGSGKPHDVISLVYDEERNIRIYHSPEDGLVITRGSGAKERPLIQIDEAGMIKISTDEKIFLDSGNIFLSNTGEGSEDVTEPTVRGVSLEKWLNKFLDDYKSHIHPTPLGAPTGFPSGKTPTIISGLKKKHITYQQVNK